MNKLELLNHYFGHKKFRQGQEEAIDAIVSGRDVLGVMPTGAGKSVCYQISAMMLPGITIVISPLISLMKDQVESLHQIGIPSASINSGMTLEEFRNVMYYARCGAFKILYVAPERLMTESFLRFSNEVLISMITVDEAHCVSQWGQDFRQSYLDIVKFLNQLPERPVVSAFTATATLQVSNDICKLLNLQNPFLITTGFDRKNLYFEVQKPKSKYDSLISFLNQNREKSGIIYCISRKLVEEVCDKLCYDGFSATRYHAGLSSDERSINQEDFLYDKKSIMVATNAFGMGIDKSNVSFVVHYNMPKDLESYYQEAGRAGRDGEPAQCILFYSGRDVRTNTFLIENFHEAETINDLKLKQSLIEKSKERLKLMTFYSTSTDCLRSYILRYFGEKPPDRCGNCSNCISEYNIKDITLEAKKIISCVFRAEQIGLHLNRIFLAKTLMGSNDKIIIDMKLNKLSTYGILSEYNKEYILKFIDFMISQKLLELRNEGNFLNIYLTKESAYVIRDKKSVFIKEPKKERIQNQVYNNKEFDIDEELFQRLKNLCIKISKKENVPSYIVFTNASMRDMCRKKPTTLFEFRKVSGVGIIKTQKYGKLFIKEISDYLSSN